jgi:hypothetical protein
MEEKIQTLLSTIWEQSLNIEDEEMIIKKLHKICFKDPLRNDQISNLKNLLILNFSFHMFKVNTFRSEFIQIHRSELWR